MYLCGNVRQEIVSQSKVADLLPLTAPSMVHASPTLAMTSLKALPISELLHLLLHSALKTLSIPL